MARKSIHMLVIDPQNDFADPKGTLFVPGADQDMQRLTALLTRIRSKIDDIHVTLDSHHLVHIANPIFFRDSNGDHPKPFTVITASDLENGKWTTTQPSYYKKTLAYLRALESGGRYPHVIWPPHCLIGSWGTAIQPDVFDAIRKWEEEFAIADMITKGSNVWTEHFSGVKAEVPEANDPSTQINTGLINVIESADEIPTLGIAGSHCVANTGRDIVNNFSNPDTIKKMVLITDCMSPVPGFEKLQDDFIKEMVSRGMRTSTSEDYLK
jgi:nicotinamidase-related amidase